MGSVAGNVAGNIVSKNSDMEKKSGKKKKGKGIGLPPRPVNRPETRKKMINYPLYDSEN